MSNVKKIKLNEQEFIISGGAETYSALPDKPHINDIELVGSMTSHDLGLIDEQDVETIMNNNKYNYVKDGLVNNTNQLTDEEQIKIEDWLGLAHNYLTYYNETPYQVSGNYVPAHKKYVDDAIKTAIANELGSDF